MQNLPLIAADNMRSVALDADAALGAETRYHAATRAATLSLASRSHARRGAL